MSKPERTGDLRLELMTFEDVSTALRSGFDTVVVPCGAVEQHGPHLPLCMDADHAEALANLVSRRLGRTLIAPTIRVGCSSHHLTFPGTISIRPETFEAMCSDYCASLVRHGFSRIIFFSGHIGNFPVLRDMLPRLRRSVGKSARIDAFVDSEAWLTAWREAVADAGGDPAAVGGHADIAETSLMMKIRPDSVRTDRFEPGHIGLLSPDQLDLMWKNGISSVTRNGIIGDPRGSTVAIGESCLERIAGLLVDAFKA
ncbi:creatininase family protein [Bradyrhizobium tropiciagri]|uniref:creatininase family protein n=1 Tax=Bradyrhizobium tropiciagri TaxID=312253 RepID=UPI001BA7DE19|nr:creatininase family protein [Bradyrhizobium tropiciagri]MBR0873271.1 creatininase family protein [Bradyrhizobium tropiciagri]